MRVLLAVFICIFVSGFAFADDSVSNNKIEFPIDTQAITPSSSADLKTATAEATPVAPSPTKSIYFFMPRPEATAVSLSYGASSKKASDNGGRSSTSSEETKITNYDFRLAYSFNDQNMLYLDSGYRSQETVVPNDTTRYRVSNGMKDVFIGGQKIAKGQNTNFIWGGSVGIPVEPRVNTNYNLYGSEGNSSSGRLSLNPYMGTETNFAGGIAGFHFGAHLSVLEQSREPGGGTQTNTIGDDGFALHPIYETNFYYEFAVAKPVKLGVMAGLARNEYEKRPGNGWINERSASLYGEGRVWEEISVTGSLSAFTQDYDSAQTITTARLGLKKLL